MNISFARNLQLLAQVNRNGNNDRLRFDSNFHHPVVDKDGRRVLP